MKIDENVLGAIGNTSIVKLNHVIPYDSAENADYFSKWWPLIDVWLQGKG